MRTEAAVEPNKIIIHKKMIRVIRRELVPNGSLNRLPTEKAFGILIESNSIDLKGKEPTKFKAESTASLRHMLFHVNQAHGKKTADRLASFAGFG